MATLEPQQIKEAAAILLDTPEKKDAALKAVAEEISGKELTDEEFGDLKKKLTETEESQSAVTAIKESFSPQTPVVIKYCPVDGKRYAARLEECPEHKVKLKIVE